ncbi:hypothetical protein QBC38DRAFT_358705, partial [Podospora fimiseda]
DYDLMKGESPESTTAYGLHFLETIRRTKDKSGRLVASYFEQLLPREKNKEYYDRIKMPISLSKIEHKLQNQDFANMSELESYFKRMVTNAKEFYPKHSQVFEDAERVRKALSNYMTKNNPAYKLVSGYSAVAAPIPDEPDTDLDRFTGDGSGAVGGEDDAEGEEDDAEGEEDEDENGGDDDDKEEEDEAEQDEDDDEEEDEHPRKIILKRKVGAGRASRGTPARGRRADRNAKAKPDHEYENVPYKGLSFQQAQEKIVEELIRTPTTADPYFINFINLPSRTYKHYFAMVLNPLSLKGLQKRVKGIQGRKPPTGISEFKSWAAFEDTTSLIWTNARFYNEEDSDLYNEAGELKDRFYEELAKAKAVVQEPPQAPKIKLRVAQDTPTPAPAPATKKITIHVGRGSTSGSPAPNQPSEALDVKPPTSAASLQLDKARSVSASVAPQSPSVSGSQTATVAQPLPGIPPRPNGNAATPMTNGGPTPPNALQNNPPASYQNGYPPAPPVIVAPPPPPPLWDNKYRAPGRISSFLAAADSLLPTVLLRTHPNIPMERRFRVEIQASPKEAQQNIVLQIPGNHSRLQLIPRLHPQLEQQGRQHKLFVNINGVLVHRATPLPIPDDPLPPNSMVFELGLQLGTNIITVTAVAALPKGQKLSNSADSEVEKLTVYANLARVY